MGREEDLIMNAHILIGLIMLQEHPRSHTNIRLSIASTCSSSMISNFPPVKCNLTTFAVTTVIN